MRAWWHERVLRHYLSLTRVSPPLWDPSARGLLIRCITCGKEWAK